jgi:CysZ protein
VISAFFKAANQVFEPELRRVLLRALLGAALVFALVCAGGWLLVAQIPAIQVQSVALPAAATWFLELLLEILGGVGVFVLAIVLYPVATTAIVGLFLEDVAESVERRHYPDLPPPAEQSAFLSIWAGAKFALIALTLNVIVLPLYLIPPLIPFVFYGVNGYLVGREYFELAALRRLPPEDVRKLRQAYRLRIFLAGALTAFLLTVPFVNLVAPIIGTAAMVHVFESLRRGARANSPP